MLPPSSSSATKPQAKKPKSEEELFELIDNMNHLDIEELDLSLLS